MAADVHLTESVQEHAAGQGSGDMRAATIPIETPLFKQYAWRRAEAGRGGVEERLSTRKLQQVRC
jgi:hypothetical protein